MAETTVAELERRVTALEDAWARFRHESTAGPTPTGADWRSVVGMFRDDPVFEQIVAEGRAIREAEREAARRDVE